MMPEKQPEIEMPSSSFWPIVLAFGLVVIAFGIVFNLILSLVGIVILIAAIVGWVLENRSHAAGEEAEDGAK